MKDRLRLHPIRPKDIYQITPEEAPDDTREALVELLNQLDSRAEALTLSALSGLVRDRALQLLQMPLSEEDGRTEINELVTRFHKDSTRVASKSLDR